MKLSRLKEASFLIWENLLKAEISFELSMFIHLLYPSKSRSPCLWTYLHIELWTYVQQIERGVTGGRTKGLCWACEVHPLMKCLESNIPPDRLFLSKWCSLNDIGRTIHLRLWKLDDEKGGQKENWFLWALVLEEALVHPVDCKDNK